MTKWTRTVKILADVTIEDPLIPACYILPGKGSHQRITFQYEGLHEVCIYCGRIGHEISVCRDREQHIQQGLDGVPTDDFKFLHAGTPTGPRHLFKIHTKSLPTTPPVESPGSAGSSSGSSYFHSPSPTPPMIITGHQTFHSKTQWMAHLNPTTTREPLYPFAISGYTLQDPTSATNPPAQRMFPISPTNLGPQFDMMSTFQRFNPRHVITHSVSRPKPKSVNDFTHFYTASNFQPKPTGPDTQSFAPSGFEHITNLINPTQSNQPITAQYNQGAEDNATLHLFGHKITIPPHPQSVDKLPTATPTHPLNHTQFSLGPFATPTKRQPDEHCSFGIGNSEEESLSQPPGKRARLGVTDQPQEVHPSTILRLRSLSISPKIYRRRITVKRRQAKEQGQQQKSESVSSPLKGNTGAPPQENQAARNQPNRAEAKRRRWPTACRHAMNEMHQVELQGNGRIPYNSQPTGSKPQLPSRRHIPHGNETTIRLHGGEMLIF
ncbi:hypothetical protein LINGRAHAP2_LOCUS24056 [Linum grandiflorum]